MLVVQNLHFLPGANSRLDELQVESTPVISQVLYCMNADCVRFAEIYTRELSEISDPTLAAQLSRTTYVYYLYVIKHCGRDRRAKSLNDRGISTLIHYQRAVHEQQDLRARCQSKRSLTCSGNVGREALRFTLYYGLSESNIHKVCQAARESLT